jgi:hypothetical protein
MSGLAFIEPWCAGHTESRRIQDQTRWIPSEGVRLIYELEVEDALTCGPGVVVKQREGTAAHGLDFGPAA